MSRPLRLEVLRRIRVHARDAASERFAAAREALALAEQAACAAHHRAGEASRRTLAAREQLVRQECGLDAASWRLRDAWAVRLAAERQVLARLGTVLAGTAARHSEVAEGARQTLRVAHRAVEVVDRLALQVRERARRARDREDDS
jgi:hypothetical protein